MAQREYEREKRETDQKEKDRELEKIKIEAEHKDKEMEMEKLKIEAKWNSKRSRPKEKSSNPRSPKLPYFDEHTDKMDSYLTRFKSYVISNKWDPSMWASYLSALLKGRALEVFVRLSKHDQSDYGQIKEALLTNFDLTERSFCKKFRDCRPEKAETFRQFSGRLASYLDKWLGLAKVEKTYEAVCDFLARDQFLHCCSHELYLYLKPKPFKVQGELAHEADLFADARGGFPGCVAKGQRETKSQFTHTYGNQVVRKPSISCKICGKAHQTHNCWHNKSKRVSAAAEIASSAEFNSPNQGGKWQNRGCNLNQGRNNYRWNQSAPGRNSNRNYNNDKVDRQLNLCKVKGEQSRDK